MDSIDAEYVNISIYSPLSGSSYTDLPRKLKTSMKDLINIKNNDNRSFLWCFIRFLNPLKIHPERIKKQMKTWLMISIIIALNFLSLRIILERLNRKIIFALMYFVIKMV